MEVFRLYPNARVELAGKDLLDLSYDMETRLDRKLESIMATLDKKQKNKLIDVKNAAARLGISTRTLERMVERGEVRKVNVGGLVRFSESQIDDIIEGRSVRA